MGSPARAAAIVADSPLGPPAEHGLRRLAAALEALGWRCRRSNPLPAAGEASLAIVAAVGPAAGPASRRLAAAAQLDVPSAPESLALAALPAGAAQPETLLVLGGDDRGLMYGLLEAARRIELAAPQTSDALNALFPALAEQPERRLRSVCIFPHHAELDREWYRSLEFWRWYFDLLALHRFNRFALTFGHQTAYLAPPYPYFVDVPEYPDVRVPGLSAQERQDNADLLRAIAQLAVSRGVDFALGVWSQHAHTYGASAVEGLDERNLAGYCAAGVRRMLELCPEISAVQLRVNSESGIHLDEGARFWRDIFAGIKASGRRVTLDLRAKGITDDTIDAGLATGLPVVVDTKFWTEHHGLPYHATLLQQGDRYVRRHSYGDQLRYPGGAARRYDFLFQLWNLGTNRFLLWADPEWVRRFAASSTLGDSAGFEVCAPLSNKGLGNRGGVWRLLADPSYEHYRWEQERYWAWYVLFGRLGYSGDADPAAWRREWAARMGQAAPQVEEALTAASGVLPLLTACHSPSASVFGYWPEKDMGGLLDLYLQVEGSDVAMFASAEEHVAERLRGAASARQSPAESGRALQVMAERAEAALAAALEAAPADDAAQRELRGVALDVRVLAHLARYHAAKRPAAEGLAWFYASGDLDSLLDAKPAAQQALATWERLVALTDGVYQDDLIFGRPNDQDGHWKDHLPYARHDVQRLDEIETIFRRYGLFDLGFDFGADLPPRTGLPILPYLHDYAVERRFTGVGPQALYSPAAGFGWGITSGLVATAAPKIDGKALRASQPWPDALPREPLYCDFVHRHPAAPYDNATFLVDLANGDYEVTVILADRSATPVAHGPMIVRLQGHHELGPVRVPAGEIVELRQRVAVTANRLTLEVSAPPQGDWLLTGLVITRVAPHIGHRPPAALRPGETFPLRATVTSAETLRQLAVRYRWGTEGPFETAPLRPAPDDPAAFPPDPGGARFCTALEVPPSTGLLEYVLEAVDSGGAVATWPADGQPRRVAVGEAGAPPVLAHRAPASAVPGQPLVIRARVTAGAPLARVTLFYRNLNQMATHDRLEMQLDPAAGAAPAAGPAAAPCEGVFVATIPPEHVSPEWDLMYHLEAVDALGNATFWPGLAAGTPYVVVPVERGGSP